MHVVHMQEGHVCSAQARWTCLQCTQPFYLLTRDLSPWPRPLGQLQYLRLWHDNSGGDRWSSWQVAFVSVRDLQTQERTIFLANRWLALDRGDGQVRQGGGRECGRRDTRQGGKRKREREERRERKRGTQVTTTPGTV